MLKIRALNRESSSDEDAPSIRKEAQVLLAHFTLYNTFYSLIIGGNNTRPVQQGFKTFT